MVPQNIAIEHMAIGREFADAHVARPNPLNPFQLVTLSGLRLLLSDDRNHLHALPPVEFRVRFDPQARDLTAFWDEEVRRVALGRLLCALWLAN